MIDMTKCRRNDSGRIITVLALCLVMGSSMSAAEVRTQPAFQYRPSPPSLRLTDTVLGARDVPPLIVCFHPTEDGIRAALAGLPPERRCGLTFSPKGDPEWTIIDGERLIENADARAAALARLDSIVLGKLDAPILDGSIARLQWPRVEGARVSDPHVTVSLTMSRGVTLQLINTPIHFDLGEEESLRKYLENLALMEPRLNIVVGVTEMEAAGETEKTTVLQVGLGFKSTNHYLDPNAVEMWRNGEFTLAIEDAVVSGTVQSRFHARMHALALWNARSNFDLPNWEAPRHGIRYLRHCLYYRWGDGPTPFVRDPLDTEIASVLLQGTGPLDALDQLDLAMWAAENGRTTDALMALAMALSQPEEELPPPRYLRYTVSRAIARLWRTKNGQLDKKAEGLVRMPLYTPFVKEVEGQADPRGPAYMRNPTPTEILRQCREAVMGSSCGAFSLEFCGRISRMLNPLIRESLNLPPGP